MKKFLSLQKSLVSRFDCTHSPKRPQRARCTNALEALLFAPVDRSQAPTASGDLAWGSTKLQASLNPLCFSAGRWRG